jgi:hypothetical protein
MPIVNGGYAKITRRVYQIEFRGKDGCSWGDYAHAASRREACSIVGRDTRNEGGNIVNVVSEDDMCPVDREQALDWLNKRGAYSPVVGAYGTRNEMFGPF